MLVVCIINVQISSDSSQIPNDLSDKVCSRALRGSCEIQAREALSAGADEPRQRQKLASKSPSPLSSLECRFHSEIHHIYTTLPHNA